jgi:CheY-like chemotaxis protein
MNKKGPIIVIEDDEDDRVLLEGVFKQLEFQNEVVYFPDGEKALEYLKDDKVYPFIILSDINLPKLNGFELRKMVHTNEGLSEKCIPYLFFSTHVNKKAVYDAYTLSVQGFFLKPHNYSDLVDTIRIIVEYWQRCYSPNSYGPEE